MFWLFENTAIESTTKVSVSSNSKIILRIWPWKLWKHDRKFKLGEDVLLSILFRIWRFKATQEPKNILDGQSN